MNTPEPNGARCAICGKPIYNSDDFIASKPKRHPWVFAHGECMYPKDKEPWSGQGDRQ